MTRFLIVALKPKSKAKSPAKPKPKAKSPAKKAEPVSPSPSPAKKRAPAKKANPWDTDSDDELELIKSGSELDDSEVVAPREKVSSRRAGELAINIFCFYM